MATRITVAWLVVVSILLLLFHTRFQSPRVAHVADEQAVVVTIRLSSGDSGKSLERERNLVRVILMATNLEKGLHPLHVWPECRPALHRCATNFKGSFALQPVRTS
jgi:hypothetical protein